MFVGSQRLNQNETVELTNNTCLSFKSRKTRNIAFITADQSDQHFPNKLTKDFFVLNELGKGGYGVVNLGFDKLKHVPVAIKTVKKRRENAETIQREINMLVRFSANPFIVELNHVITTEKRVYIVFEYAAKGDLHDEIARSQGIEEKRAKWFMAQIFNAVEFLHKNNVAHRDLKPEK